MHIRTYLVTIRTSSKPLKLYYFCNKAKSIFIHNTFCAHTYKHMRVCMHVCTYVCVGYFCTSEFIFIDKSEKISAMFNFSWSGPPKQAITATTHTYCRTHTHTYALVCVRLTSEFVRPRVLNFS